jgi:putative ABC transport system permease protein
VSDLLQDLKYGWRTLWKNPGFSVVALLTIAVGIGSNAAIFSYIDGALLRPLPYEHADRMVKVSERPPHGSVGRVSAMEYLDLVREGNVFEYVTAQQWTTAALTGVPEPFQVPNERVSLQFFDIFTAKPLLGRLFAPGEDQPGHEHVAILSHAFWVSQFASDPGVIGKTLILDDEPYTVIGVMTAGTFDRTATKIWRPLVFSKEDMNRYARRYNFWAVLKPGVTLAQARAQLDTLGARIAHDYPASNKDWGIQVDTFESVLVGRDVKLSLYLLMASVAMVLLIVCANLANLTLARGAAREREVALRVALGAGRWRIVRQFMTESLLLSLGGGVLGVGAAYGGLAWLKLAVPRHFLPPSAYVDMDGRILGFILVLALLTGVIFGLYPALRASRPDLTESLKQGGNGASVGRGGRSLRNGLVTAEVALAFVLLTGAGLLIHSFFKILQVDPGFEASNVVTAHLGTSTRRYATGPLLEAHLRALVARVEALPGVREVSLATVLPMEGWGWGEPFAIAGQKSADIERRPVCYFKMISPSYFRALGMRLLKGRLLAESDQGNTAPVVVINETMAKRYFAGVDPVGKSLLIFKFGYNSAQAAQEVSWEIVGVVADEKLQGLSVADDQSPGVYVSTAQSLQPYQSLVVRTVADPRPIMRALVGAVHEVDPDQTVDDVRTLEQIKSASVADDRIRTLLLGIFAAIALLLSAIGLYGVIAFTVAQRTREIGIRAALGATPANIQWVVLRGGLGLTGLGLAIGFLASLGLSRVLSSVLFQVPLFDPATLGVVIFLLVAMALLACCLPARRATKIDPIIALRTD